MKLLFKRRVLSVEIVCDCETSYLLVIDLRVGSSKLTRAFQVGSSRSVVASPSKFSGAVGQCTSHSPT